MSRNRLRAVAYAHSTADGPGASLRELRQVALIRAFCEDHELSLVATILEQRDKPGQECHAKLDQLLAEVMAKEAPYDLLLVDEESRISRDSAIALAYRNRFAAAGLKLVVTSDHEAVREG